MPSAIATPTFAAQNSNILNDGSADSPRGYAISTDANVSMTIANTRVSATATSASRTVILPTTSVKAGMVVEVLTACSGGYTITINSSGANLIDTLKGTKGKISLMALQDTPTAAAHWRVVDVVDEGTFTPVLTFGGAAVGMTYSVQAGVYQRIGNRCNTSVKIVLTAKGSSTGSAIVSGIPYLASSSSGGEIPGTFYGNGCSANGFNITPYILANTGNMYFSCTSVTVNASGAANLAEVHFSNTAMFMANFSYLIA